MDARKGIGSLHMAFFFFLLSDLCVCVLVFGLLVCLCESVGPSGTRVMYDNCDPLCGCWKLNPSLRKSSQYSNH